MTLFITSLNSGSNGNCYYIGNDTEAVLIDAGISCRETERRMKRLNLSMSLVKAVFVSHEHTDHITGIPVLSKKYQLPVYITPETMRHSNIAIEKHLQHNFEADRPVSVGNLTVYPFSKSHDAADPHSFIISYGHLNVGVFTDIGYSCDNIKKYFPQCHAVFLESNYCHDMLSNGNYPFYLKKRISSDEGHLSNMQALDLFTKYRGSQLSHLLLSHLSKNNNSPELVDSIFRAHAGNTRIVVASRYQETPVFRIEADPGHLQIQIKRSVFEGSYQLSLFQ